MGARIKLTLQEVGNEDRERRKAWRVKIDAWERLQTYGEKGSRKTKIEWKRLAAVCSLELEILM